MRRRGVLIRFPLLTEMITIGWKIGPGNRVFSAECMEGVPSGASLIHVVYDPRTDCVIAIFEHESFDEVAPGELIPLVPVSHRFEYDTAYTISDPNKAVPHET